ncbi:MAG: hypothetical protein J0H63_09990 [Rhizobiales bacterium]|mgnify:CR=1 FL=1|nr:hypothetical protein [Hyphomicrobiales bacterium]MBN9010436.1 hypothetical protein [Hyphomicrobiales bacterium]
MSADREFELTAELQEEFDAAGQNGHVGQQLLSETDKVRVWSIRLKPGERVGFHAHVLDYFWTAVTAGTSRSHVNGGPPKTTTYKPGETRQFAYGAGERMIHDLENIGDTELVFVTVEFLHSANLPLRL